MAKAKKQKEWCCARCARRKEIATNADPVLLRECDWCNIKNWCRPVGKVSSREGRVMEKRVTEDGVALPVHDKKEKEVEVQSEDAEIPEEVVPAEPPTDAVPEAKEENVTEDIDAQIAALEAKKAELEK